MRNLIKNLALSGTSIVLALILLELFVRIFSPQNIYPFVYKDDPLGFYRLKENYHGIHKAPEFKVRVDTNSNGLRDYEYPIIKPEKAYRILVLGDSFTFGEGVEMEKGYTKALEKRLNSSNKDRRYEVINASAFDWGTSEEYLYLKHYGLRFKPDMVVLGFFIGNDIWQNRFGSFNLDKEGRLIAIGSESVNTRLNRFLKQIPGYLSIRERSQLLALLRRKINIFLERDVFKAYFGVTMSLYEGRPNFDAKKGLDITASLIKDMKALCDQNGVKFVLVLIPSVEQVYPERFGLKDLKVNFPNGVINGIGKKNGIPVVDLYPSYREGGKNYYYEENKHWNEEGHKLAGEALAGKLTPFLP